MAGQSRVPCTHSPVTYGFRRYYLLPRSKGNILLIKSTRLNSVATILAQQTRAVSCIAVLANRVQFPSACPCTVDISHRLARIENDLVPIGKSPPLFSSSCSSQLGNPPTSPPRLFMTLLILLKSDGWSREPSNI